MSKNFSLLEIEEIPFEMYEKQLTFFTNMLQVQNLSEENLKILNQIIAAILLDFAQPKMVLSI